ncbi:MAG: methionyl-tRNA formyltransferase, partial [Nevskiaceae bacterium]
GETPGTVLSTENDSLLIATARGRLAVLELQRPGGKPQPAVALRRSWNPSGQRFL